MEQQPTLWQVAESQQVQTSTEQVTEQVVEQTNLTWTSSWVDQTTQTQTEEQKPSEQTEATQEKTLEDVAKEQEIAQNQQANQDALDAIIKEANKDVVSPTPADNVAAPAVDEEKSQKEADALKAQIDEITSTKEATTVAKKVYLAYEKERSQHQLDNETNAQTIANLKELVKQLNAKTNSMEIDPRVVKLDDENYALYRIRSNYKSNSTKENKESLTKFYLTEIAVMHPELNVNKLVAYMNDQNKSSNTIGQNNWTVAPVADPVEPVRIPRGIPQSQRGIL